MPHRRPKLAAFLFAGFGAAAILPSAGLGLVQMQRWTDVEVDHAERELAGGATFLALEGAELIKAQTKIVEHLAERLQSNEAATEDIIAAHQASHTQQVTIHRVDVAGHCVHTAAVRSGSSDFCASRARRINDTIREQRKIWVGLSGSQGALIAIAVPLEDSEWNYAGYVVATIANDSVQSAMHRLASTVADDWILVGPDDIVVAARSPTIFVGDMVGDHPVFRAARDVDRVSVTGTSLAKQPIRMVADDAEAAAIRWLAAVSRPEAAVQAQARSAAGIAAIASALAALTGLMLSAVFARGLAHPIADLSKVAVSIGQGDFAQSPAPPRRWLPKELAAVNEAVLQMAQRLRKYTAGLEAEVAQRTAELTASNAQLEESLEVLAKTQGDLVMASRQAGMAEVATGVLHNVGNVLNSVNVSAEEIQAAVRGSRGRSLGDIAQLLNDHADDVGSFVTNDARGQNVPAYLATLAEVLDQERHIIDAECRALGKNIGHIIAIVSAQQNFAKTSCVHEVVAVQTLIDDAIRLGAPDLAAARVELLKNVEAELATETDRHAIMQVLVNLVGNACDAIHDADANGGRLSISAYRRNEHVEIVVEDSGIGMSEDTAARIFEHGFTTKAEGHGFGLHNAALSVASIGGSISVASGGIGHGSRFTLVIPAEIEAPHAAV